MQRKHLLYLAGFGLLLLIAPVAYQIDRMAQSLPAMDGEISVRGLAETVPVQFDGYGIPTVEARSRTDAFRALGFLHARDRLFQMDLMRRKTAGRLSEIFGVAALQLDRQQRFYQFSATAEAALAALPKEQRDALQAYSEGVNARIEGAAELAPEFRALRYRPENWQPTDSLLVALGMFQTLTASERDERSLTIMSRMLPEDITAFLTPDTDPFSSVLLGGSESSRPERAIPIDSIAKLIRQNDQPLAHAAVRADEISIGSNNWAVSGAKTEDGRAILADDMHLPLGVPNIWYRARMRYGAADLNGVTLPGLPMLIAGSNGKIAWGFTNVDADLIDLVALETNPAEPSQYRSAEGWRPFELRSETITVKDRKPDVLKVIVSQWGPVSPDRLLGSPVAIHWTALQPGGVNLGLMDMDSAFTLEAAMTVFNRAGSPPQNVLIADTKGRIGWTYMGFFPKRVGFDGSVSASWAKGRIRWDGFIPGEKLPRLIDPPQGFLATANNRTLGKNFPFVIGHNFSYGYRAFRANQVLQSKPKLNEADLFALQLDTVSEFYEFYRKLALELLTYDVIRDEPILADAAAALKHWNGRMDGESVGIAILAPWRQDLAQAVFSPMVARCAAVDAGFAYEWREQETPLRALLTQRAPETLPDLNSSDWPSFLLARLRRTALDLKQRHPSISLQELTWATANPTRIPHPFSRSFEPLALLLDMPMDGVTGCNSFCLKVLRDTHGASERLVVSPAHPEDGILHMPGGQSGHLFSPHFRDQQPAWAKEQPLPFLPGDTKHRLKLTPAPPH